MQVIIIAYHEIFQILKILLNFSKNWL